MNLLVSIFTGAKHSRQNRLWQW